MVPFIGFEQANILSMCYKHSFNQIFIFQLKHDILNSLLERHGFPLKLILEMMNIQFTTLILVLDTFKIFESWYKGK